MWSSGSQHKCFQIKQIQYQRTPKQEHSIRGTKTFIQKKHTNTLQSEVINKIKILEERTELDGHIH
jgi:hypothetical protein